MDISLEVLRDMARNEAALPTSRRDAVMHWIYRLVERTVGADNVSRDMLLRLFAELDAYPGLKSEHEVLKDRLQALTAEHESLKANHAQLLATHDSLQVHVSVENQKAVLATRDALLNELQSFREEQTARYAGAWYRRFWRWIRRLV
jgi:hypothetical protein